MIKNKRTHLEIDDTLIILSSIFSMIVIAGNIFALKFTTIGPFSTPAGMICFPFTYTLGDIITEIYGYSIARKVILMGLFNLVLFYIFLKLVIALPPASFWHLQKEFEAVFGLSSRILLGTIVGYLSGELVNSRILSFLKYITQGNIFVPRAVASTIIGVTTDTLFFNIAAFLFIIPFSILLPFILQQYLLKICFEIVGAFAAGFIVKKIKKTQKIDIIDPYPFKWIEKYKKNQDGETH